MAVRPGLRCNENVGEADDLTCYHDGCASGADSTGQAGADGSSTEDVQVCIRVLPKLRIRRTLELNRDLGKAV